jgi:uncharacterized surface protein with fasciclin (FAS1) repeats
MSRKKLWILPLVLAFAALASCGDDSDTSTANTAAVTTPPTTAAMSTTAPPMSAATKDIVDTAVGAGKFTVLAEALTKADLVNTLKGTGPFTVFAPTDDAFAAALKSLNITKDQLFADKAKLTSILTYHVVSGRVPAAEVVKLDGKEAKTVNGAPVKVTVKANEVLLNSNTKVTQTDVAASNGIIHVIDTVLLPSS